MSDNIDWAAHTQPISFDRKASDEFSEESLIIPHYSDDECAIPYKPEYIWSLDSTLAKFLDTTLTAIMGFDYTPPPEHTERARNAFRAYAHKDDGPFNKDNPFPFETYGTPERDELEWALGWLKENFTALWT